MLPMSTTAYERGSSTTDVFFNSPREKGPPEQLPEGRLLQFAQELSYRQIPRCFDVAASDFGPTMRSYITHIAQIVPVGELEIPAAFRLSKEGDIITIAANMYDRPSHDETVSRHVVLHDNQETGEAEVIDERSATFLQHGLVLRSAHSISAGAFMTRTLSQEMIITGHDLKRVIKESMFPFDSHTPGRQIVIEHYPKDLPPYVRYATPKQIRTYNSVISHLGFTDGSLETLVR